MLVVLFSLIFVAVNSFVLQKEKEGKGNHSISLNITDRFN